MTPSPVLSVRARARGLALGLLGALLSAAAVGAPSASADTLTRASTAAGGAQGNNISYEPSVSADGRYVAFTSGATELVTGDTNNTTDVFVKDTQTGQITRVSTTTGGGQASGTPNMPVAPSISADGRYVAFFSDATDLVAGDTNSQRDVFVKDTQTDTTTRVSTATGGAQGDNASYNPAISADGRYVAFYSAATDLVTGDSNGRNDVFVKDTVTDTTTRVSTATGGAEGDNASYNPAVSADGRYVAFSSSATNLIAGDSDGAGVFVKDTQTNTTTRVAATAGASSVKSAISGDGRFVAFDSSATNLVAGDSNGQADVFVKDTHTNTLTRASTATGGAQANNRSMLPAISADGRFVMLVSDATNLVEGDTNALTDVFVKDTQTDTTVRVSAGVDGTQGDSVSSMPAISADGRAVVFTAVSTNLIAGDTNGQPDVFKRTLLPSSDGPAATISAGTLVGETLTASAGAGFQGAWPHGPMSVQWERCAPDLSGCVTIAGANGSRYTLTAEDDGRRVRPVEVVGNLLGTTHRPGQATALVDTDTDSDGTGNRADSDDDGDGVPDTADAFPLDPTRGKPETPQPENPGPQDPQPELNPQPDQGQVTVTKPKDNTITIVKNNRASLPVTCSDADGCVAAKLAFVLKAGKLKLTGTIKVPTLKAGQKTTVLLKLTTKQAIAFKRAGIKAGQLQIKVGDQTTSVKITVKANKTNK